MREEFKGGDFANVNELRDVRKPKDRVSQSIPDKKTQPTKARKPHASAVPYHRIARLLLPFPFPKHAPSSVQHPFLLFPSLSVHDHLFSLDIPIPFIVF